VRLRPSLLSLLVGVLYRLLAVDEYGVVDTRQEGRLKVKLSLFLIN
jgi:hypothetical protein